MELDGYQAVSMRAEKDAELKKLLTDLVKESCSFDTIIRHRALSALKQLVKSELESDIPISVLREQAKHLGIFNYSRIPKHELLVLIKSKDASRNLRPGDPATVGIVHADSGGVGG